MPLLHIEPDISPAIESQSCHTMNGKLLRAACEIIQIRASTPLLNLTDARDVFEKVSFPTAYNHSTDTIVMEVRNGPPSRFQFMPPVCDRFARVVVAVSMRRSTTRLPYSKEDEDGPLVLHPIQAASTDE